MSKISIKDKWYRIIEGYYNFSGLISKNVKLPKDMLDMLCYYAEFVALQETEGYIKNIGNHSQLPMLLVDPINKYITDNAEKLEIRKFFFDALSNDICFELSDGSIKYLNNGNPIVDESKIEKYFPENFIDYLNNYDCDYLQFSRNQKLDDIID